MDPATIALIVQALELASTVIIKVEPALAAFVPNLIDMLQNNRAPTSAEFTTLNTLSAQLRQRLHAQATGGA
jgi:hypothetical protein